MLQLTKNQQSALGNITALKTISIFFTLYGLLGIFHGFYSSFFCVMSPVARSLNFSLPLISSGLPGVSLLLIQAYSIIEKLKNKDQFIP